MNDELHGRRLRDTGKAKKRGGSWDRNKTWLIAGKGGHEPQPLEKMPNLEIKEEKKKRVQD